jgi:oligoribonuclease
MLAWMDLEMTGLDPATDHIVEIATLITDDDLELVAEGPDVVIHVADEVLAAMAPVVQRMHAASGLTERIRAATTTLEQAGAETLAFLRQHIEQPGSVPLCGNSIGTDRRFLARYLPEIETFLHYRSVDVSTIKELARRWYPGVFDEAPHKATTHRALDDIRESLGELRFYRQRLFVPAIAPTAPALDPPAGA